MNPRRATGLGLLAILLWGMVVGLIRGVSEGFGPVGGAALIYSLASVLLVATVGIPRLSRFPRAYLIWGSVLFVAYELCFSLSIGFAHSGRQAIEVAMVNYLWPSLTIVLAVLVNGQRATWLIVPGFLLSTLGIGWVLGGAQGLDPAGMMHNIRGNPLAYGLALAGALIWAGYCTLTARIAQGANGITLFFILVAVTLWAQYPFAREAAMQVDARALGFLLLAAVSMGFGYAAWNVGILHGHVAVLAAASYFVPLLSAGLAALLLRTPLAWPFWQGAAMICLGSALCWQATRTRRRRA